MSIPAYVTGIFSKGVHTETAATIIQENIPGSDGNRIALNHLLYSNQGTAHTLSFMYPGDRAGCRTTASADAAISQAVLNVTDAPVDPAGNAVASGDVIAYETSDGWEFNTVSSLSTKAITLGTNIASPVLAGAKVRVFGIAADKACQQAALAASVVTELGDGNGIYFIQPEYCRGDPVVVQSNNATAAGTLQNLIALYLKK